MEGKIDLKIVQELLDSDIISRDIEEGTGISKTTINNYRNGTSDPLNMKVGNALILQNFYLNKK